MIKLSVIKKKCLCYNGKILCQFKKVNINKGINFKIVLWLRCLPPHSPVITVERITLVSRGLTFLGLFPICNIIFPIIDQCRHFFTTALILKRSLTLSNTNTYIWSKKESIGSSMFEIRNKNIFSFIYS